MSSLGQGVGAEQVLRNGADPVIADQIQAAIGHPRIQVVCLPIPPAPTYVPMLKNIFAIITRLGFSGLNTVQKPDDIYPKSSLKSAQTLKSSGTGETTSRPKICE